MKLSSLMENEQLKKRILSFLWRTGAMVVSAILAFVIDNATSLEIPPYVVILAGLGLSEITKYLNRK